MTAPIPCFNCGKPTTPKGQKAERRYCMARACRNAKNRWYYETHRGEEVPVDQRPCSCCGDELPARPRRATDADYGRWCRKARCQRHRAIFDVQYAEAAAEWTAREEVDCSECGRRGARKGFAHRKVYEQDWCYTTGEVLPMDEMMRWVARAAWVEQNREVSRMSQAAADSMKTAQGGDRPKEVS